MPKKRIAFLIPHGTDTMAWGLSYLTYALKDCPAPVALVGAQIPMTERFSSSDGYANIELAVNTLAELCQPLVFLAFDHGKKLFTITAWKHDKWDPDAFVGHVIAERDSNRFIQLQKMHVQRKTIDRLFLIRTGGTIEANLTTAADGMEHLAHQGEKPDVAAVYILNEFKTKKGIVDDVKDVPFAHLDSSDLTPVEWKAIAEEIARCCKEEEYTAKADTCFEDDVRVVMCNPFLKTADYERLVEGAAGVVLLGYGAGNVNIQRHHEYSPLPALERYVERGGHAVLCSHVDCGVIDSLYENGSEVFRPGLAAPGAHYSPAAAQIKLSYILGHFGEIEKAAEKLASDKGGTTREWEVRLVRTLFLAGARFSDAESLGWFENTLGVTSTKYDFMVNRPFDLALERAVELLLKKKKKGVITLTDEEAALPAADLEAIIVKPDINVGDNRRGEPVDAARSVAAILEKSFEWDVGIAEPSYLRTRSEGDMCAELSRATMLFWEGGSPSVYDETTFNEVGRTYLLDLFKRVFRARASGDEFPPSIMICLSHQLAAQSMFDMVLELGPISAGTTMSGEALEAWNEFLETRDRLARAMELGEHAVGRGREKERGIARLVPFEVKVPVPEEVRNAHDVVARNFSGLVEDIIPVEPLDLAMLHGDVVLPGPALFTNWALHEAHCLKRRYRDLAALPALAGLPIGLEITSSTLKGEDVLTHVASMAVYYQTPEGYLSRDLTFQFHPELLDDGALTPALSGQEIVLSFENDGVKLLVGAVMAVKERNRILPMST